jgi:hypothetical protein
MKTASCRHVFLEVDNAGITGIYSCLRCGCLEAGTPQQMQANGYYTISTALVGITYVISFLCILVASVLLFIDYIAGFTFANLALGVAFLGMIYILVSSYKNPRLYKLIILVLKSVTIIIYVLALAYHNKKPNKALHPTPATRVFSVGAASAAPEELARLLLVHRVAGVAEL